MKKGSTIFLKAVLVLIALVALFLLIRLPQTEGRAVGLDLFHIYADPFILYSFVIAIPFFVALYQAYLLLGYIGENKVFSNNSISALRKIKFSASILAMLMILALVYIRIFHDKNDDPAGFIAMGIMVTFISAVVATTAGVFERTVQTAVELKSENDLTV